MAEIEFSVAEKQVIVAKIKHYFREELDQDIGQFDAEFLLDFFAEDLGSFFYNRGLYDAQAVVEERLQSINDALYEIEKTTGYRR